MFSKVVLLEYMSRKVSCLSNLVLLYIPVERHNTIESTTHYTNLFPLTWYSAKTQSCDLTLTAARFHTARPWEIDLHDLVGAAPLFIAPILLIAVPSLSHRALQMRSLHVPSGLRHSKACCRSVCYDTAIAVRSRRATPTANRRGPR